MKILIIYPYCLEGRLHEEDISVMPIGAYYVGALLRENGHDTELLNFYNFNKAHEKIRAALEEKQPDVIGFSILHANRWGGIEIARIAREVNPGVKIVFGGIGATFLWKHLLTHFKVIDFIVLGEGEHTFLRLIESLRKQDHDAIGDIRGIAFRKGAEIVRTESPEPVKNLDDLPVPANHFTYQHVSLTRGCPGNCTFCGSPRFWQRKVRFHSPDYFVNQLEILSKRGVSFFYVSDDTFTLKKQYVLDVCQKILERNLCITWAAISRVDHVDEDILYWMRKAGCIQISYGVESGSEKIRKQLGKNITTEQIRNAFRLTTKYGILARAYFIYGCPGETWETIQESIDLINEIKPMSVIFYILDIFPGTELYADFGKKFLAGGGKGDLDDIWTQKIEDIMYFESDPNLSQEQVLAFGQKLRASFYENLRHYADAIELTDKKEFCQMHSDFLSRLGMTFSHGDYARNRAIRDKDQIARKLYEKALSYYPDHRAYLGLGVILQKSRDYVESVEILSKGVAHFPENESLNMSLGISYMNLEKYAQALPHFLKFERSEQAAYYVNVCQNALKN